MGAEAAVVAVARRRLRLLGGVFALAMVVLGLRLIDLALLSADAAIHVRGTPSVARARRADIVDRHGTLLATDYPKASLFADPAEVLDPDTAATRLAAVLGLDRARLLAKLTGAGRFAWLKRHLTDAEHRAVIRLGLPGIGLRTEWHRVYPQRELTAHVVGYVGIENQGLAGIEYSFDDRLTGVGLAEGPLMLSLDLRVQEVVRSELAHAVRRFRALGGTGIVLDARSGDILAMVSLPDFDPNRYREAARVERFNRNTQGTYELGSLFKLFAVAMALDAGVARLDDDVDAREPLRFGRHRIRDFHAKRRWMSLPEVLAFSSNIGAAKLAEALGTDTQRAYFDRLGLTARHPVRLVEVGDPLLPSPWRPINTVTAAYGHGIAVSPLQVADAVGAIVCPQARPVAHLTSSGQTELRPPSISSGAARKMRWLMWLTVAGGSGKQAAVPGYLIGGKTGSADKPGPNGDYRDGGLLSSFVAAFPIDRPRYVVLVTLDEPRGDAATQDRAHGGWTAAPTVGRIISRIGPLVGLPPITEGADAWFRDRLIEGRARNGRTGRIEPSFAAAMDRAWDEPTPEQPACG